ncbi:hypothetical protein JXZ92_03215 [Mycoplasma sp. CSL10137]|uniref:hypothetical protein n=1 Tax=Mycoplasma sp. CSL10137 TaxID=2813824 RepID=UPI00197B2A4C|nr:hypothetical protein [Mycoplasma sp. CSL10137]MBN4083810.1 hypothetical protein [Mycoplasma sp. CSL10137]
MKFQNQLLAPFDKDSHRVYMYDKSEIEFVEDSNGNLCFTTGDNRIYEAKTSKGYQFTRLKLWLIKKGFDPSNTNILNLVKFYSVNTNFTNHNINKIKKN